jgi:ABC-type glycerol-3-phosphate transport system substrate-binding protein
MKNTVFQFVLIAGLIFSVIIAVLIFSGVIPVPGKKNPEASLSGKVIIWGTVPEVQMNTIIDPIQKSIKNYSVSYVEKNPESYEDDLVQALASGKGPDMIVLDPGLLIKHSDKIASTPYKTFSERDYKDLYVDISNLFLGPDGVLAIPISIDPMVMYYNKDTLSAAGIVSPPLHWNELLSLAANLSKVDENGTLTKNMVAFGEYDNVEHAKDIVSMLALQLGNPIVEAQLEYDESKKPYYTYKAALGRSNQDGVRVGESVLRFYTQFSDPAKQTYSWNKTFPSSRTMFISGKLGFYFGYASEYKGIADKNPNLRFDIARVPQVKDYPSKITVGQVLGVAVLKSSKNIDAAFNTNQYLVSPEFAPYISGALGTAPARRDLLSVKQEDAYNGIVYPSAIIASSWYDPDAIATETLFKRMITNVVSGRTTLYESVNDFVNSLQDMLP